MKISWSAALSIPLLSSVVSAIPDPHHHKRPHPYPYGLFPPSPIIVSTSPLPQGYGWPFGPFPAPSTISSYSSSVIASPVSDASSTSAVPYPVHNTSQSGFPTHSGTSPYSGTGQVITIVSSTGSPTGTAISLNTSSTRSSYHTYSGSILVTGLPNATAGVSINGSIYVAPTLSPNSTNSSQVPSYLGSSYSIGTAPSSVFVNATGISSVGANRTGTAYTSPSVSPPIITGGPFFPSNITFPASIATNITLSNTTAIPSNVSALISPATALTSNATSLPNYGSTTRITLHINSSAVITLTETSIPPLTTGLFLSSTPGSAGVSPILTFNSTATPSLGSISANATIATSSPYTVPSSLVPGYIPPSPSTGPLPQPSSNLTTTTPLPPTPTSSRPIFLPSLTTDVGDLIPTPTPLPSSPIPILTAGPIYLPPPTSFVTSVSFLSLYSSFTPVFNGTSSSSARTVPSAVAPVYFPPTGYYGYTPPPKKRWAFGSWGLLRLR